jgi:hypothetical protein
VTLTGANTATPSFTAPTGAATLGFELEVCDSEPLCDTDTVMVAVQEPPPPSVQPPPSVLPSPIAAAPNPRCATLRKKLKAAKKKGDKAKVRMLRRKLRQLGC